MTRAMKNTHLNGIGLMPSEWKLVKVKKIFNISRGRVIAKTELSDEGVYPVYSSQTKNNGCLGFIDTYDYDEPQLTWTTDGANAGTVFLREGKYNCTNICGTLLPKTKDNNLHYLKYSLAHVAIYHKRADTNGYKIMSNEMAEIEIPLPDKRIQKNIATFLDGKTAQIDSIIENTKQSIIEFKKYKQALITETVTKGLNPEVQMKDSGIEYLGEVPAQWNVSRVRYLGTLQNGISKSGDAFGSGFPFLSYGDVYRDIELPKKASGLVESSESERLNYSVTYGDVLFTRTSETIEEVGFSSTCLETIPNVVFAGFVIRFRPMTNDLYPRFSKYYFRSQIHRSFFAKEMNLVIRASLSQQLLKKMPILLPSIEEQQQIADYLDEKCAHIDSLIADKEKLIREFEDYKKALIYEYVTGKKEVE